MGDEHCEEDELANALSNLNLPHMPPNNGVGQHDADEPRLPTIRILVVADIDLSSASALAEYTLQQRNQVFDASRIDLCIACGSFGREEDLLPYLSGKARERLKEYLTKSTGTPFFRSREETAALEGLVTASLSQLESIVCRVVYCPGSSDPLSVLLPRESRRLTPNSRNINQQWLPLCPALGVAGLLYLESPEQAMQAEKLIRRSISGDDAQQDENEDENTANNEMNELCEKLMGLQQR